MPVPISARGPARIECSLWSSDSSQPLRRWTLRPRPSDRRASACPSEHIGPRDPRAVNTKFQGSDRITARRAAHPRRHGLHRLRHAGTRASLKRRPLPCRLHRVWGSRSLRRRSLSGCPAPHLDQPVTTRLGSPFSRAPYPPISRYASVFVVSLMNVAISRKEVSASGIRPTKRCQT